MFIKVFASGTNVQRLAKSSKNVTGVIYSAYSQLESTESNIVKRKFYATNLEQLKTVVEKQNAAIQPSWTKIWGKPNANKAFISSLFNSLVGNESLVPSLNLNQITSDSVSCFMVLVSAYKKEMSQINKIINKTLPEYSTVVLNGDYTSNKEAESVTKQAIAQAKLDGKKGVIILANQMGARSYSISEIQATIIAYDRGSVDASQQKVSRCLTPGITYDGEQKQYGHIVDISFDPNRSENIEKMLIDEIIQVQKSEDIDFQSATSFVLNSMDLSKINEFGYVEEINEEDMFGLLSNDDNLLRVADVTVDVSSILENGLLDILSEVNGTDTASSNKKLIVGEDVINKIKQQETEQTPKNKKDADVKKIEDIINQAIKAINMSATSIYWLANQGDTYKECLEVISKQEEAQQEFKSVIGISPKQVISLLNNNALNENVLDVLVANSKNFETL